jgi:hypothetical protein
MALAVTECIVSILAPRKVAVPLWPEERLERSICVVLRGVPVAIAACGTRLRATVESAGSLLAVVRTERA